MTTNEGEAEECRSHDTVKARETENLLPIEQRLQATHNMMQEQLCVED